MAHASHFDTLDRENLAQRLSGAAPEGMGALQRRLVRLQVGPLTIGDVITLLPLSGKTREARAQLLRRLERRGVVPPARRSLIAGRRYWHPREVAEIGRRLAGAA